MNYENAVKQVRAAKKPESYLSIRFGYSDRIVVPHKAALVLLDALATAEHYTGHYGKSPCLKQLDSDSLQVEAMSQSQYEDIKVAQLLNISLEDLKEAKKQSETA